MNMSKQVRRDELIRQMLLRSMLIVTTVLESRTPQDPENPLYPLLLNLFGNKPLIRFLE